LALPISHGRGTNTTSYTSVAFAHSASPDDVKLVNIWPAVGTGNSSADLVPTIVEYTKPEMTWGYEVQKGAINPGSKPLEWFKLLLQEQDAPLPASQNRLDHIEGRENAITALSEVNERFGGLDISRETPEQETKKILDELNITTVQVIADFLEKIKETTLENIERTYWMQSEIDSKVQWILTVPAIWKDAAKNSMIRAARQAGFGERGVDFQLISEPECGATYSLKVIQPNNLSVFASFQ